MSKKKITNITKNVTEGCYMARIMRAKKKYQKNFPAKKLGGWKEARKQALEWVEQMKKELPPMQETTYDVMTSKNTSGVVGVAIKNYDVKRPSGKVYNYWSWVANWPGCERRGGVRFNISDTYSDEDAFTLAVLARRSKCSDRKKLFKQFDQIKDKKEHKEILNLKQVYLDWE